MEQRVKDVVHEMGEWRLAAAFRQNTFVYGTAGTGSLIVKGLKNWAARPRTKPPLAAAARPGVPSAPSPAASAGQPPAQGEAAIVSVLTRELNLFDPGRRASTYLANGYQMMDMYYGQAGNTLYEKRDPVIGEYVHRAMGYKGPFSMKQSGRDAYQETLKTSVEGWQWNSPQLPEWEGRTATKEISRLIRLGVATFGGTIIFEGKEVYYSQVFETNPPRISDTDAEAREMFQYFTPGTSTAAFGKGRVVFYWCGQEAVPTKLHFLTNWTFAKDPNSDKVLTHSLLNMARQGGARAMNTSTLLPMWNNFQDVPRSMLGKEQEYLSVLERMRP